jgi:hypothetical protein
MNEELSKKLLSSINITRDSLKNSMQITFESYTEILSRLDLLTYLINYDNEK